MCHGSQQVPVAGLQHHRVTAVTAVAFVLLLATACATGPGGRHDGGASREPPSSGTMSSGPLPPSSGGAETANVLRPEPAVGLSRHRWSRVEPVPGGSDILVYGTLSSGPPCSVLARVDVSEGEADVVLTVWTGRRRGADCRGPQQQLAYPFVTRVRLHAPLNGRRVVDGAA
jgi:hypothetical protein